MRTGRVMVGISFAVLLAALAARAFPWSSEPALVIGGVVVLLAAFGVRALRFRLLARAARSDASDASLAGIAASTAAADAAFFRGVGAPVALALLARRGAGVARATGVALALAALDLLALAGLGLAAAFFLYGSLPGYVRTPLVVIGVAALALPALVLALRTPPAAALSARLPAAWRDAGFTPAAVAREAFDVVRRAGPARVVALTIAAVLVEASLFALAGASAGVSPLASEGAGLALLAARASIADPIGSIELSPLFTLLLVTAGGDYTPAFHAAMAADRLRTLVAAALGVAPAIAWAVSRARARMPAADAALARTEGFRVAALVALGLWIRRVQWSEGLPFSRRDAHGHHEYVLEVLSGNVFPLAPQFFMAYHPPLYYWLNAPLWVALGGAGYLVFNVAASLALALVTYAILRRLRVPQPWALGALLVSLVLPALTGASLGVTNDVLVALFVALMVWSALPFLSRRATPRDGLALGLATAAAMLTKFNAIVPAACLALGIVFAARGRLAAPHWIAGGVALGVAAPWYVRNVVLLGAPAIGNEGMAVRPSVPGDAPFVPTLVHLDGSSRATDVWGLLVQSTFWPFDAPFGLPSPAAEAIGFPWGVAQLFLLAGMALAALALVGSFAALARGTAAERTLAVLALGMLAAQVAYFASFPITAAVNGAYLLPALPAYAYLSERTARGLVERVRSARAVDPSVSRG